MKCSMNVLNKTRVQRKQVYALGLALALLLGGDTAMAGTFFTDDFEDQNLSDGTPVSWTQTFPNTQIDASANGDMIVTNRGQSGGIWADSLDPIYKDGIFRTQFSWDTVSGAADFAGLFVRAPGDGQASYWVGIQPDGLLAVGHRGVIADNIETVAWKTTSLDPVNHDVIMEIANKGSRVSMTVWQEGETRPSRPQLAFSDSSFRTGAIGVYSNGNAGTAAVAFRYFQALPYLSGDFSDSEALDVADIDLLSREMTAGTNDLSHDLTGDALVNQGDLAFWVHDLKKTWFGDANLDGEFNQLDLVRLLQAGQYDDSVPGNSTWATGDWNTDGEFDQKDLVLALQDGGYGHGRLAALAVVPEPSSILLILAGFLGLTVLGLLRTHNRCRLIGLVDSRRGANG